MARNFIVSFIILILAVMLTVPACYAGCACGNAQPCSGKQAVGRPQPCSGKAAAGLCNDNAWKKLGRGLCNMVTFPLEIPNQISRTNISDGPMAAFTWGLVKGVGMTGFRGLVGIYEILTFPMPCPEGYKPILTDPEFFLEDQIC